MSSTPRKRILVQVDDEIDNALKDCADADDRSVSNLIVSVMREYLVSRGFLEPKKPSRTQGKKVKQ